MRKETHHINLDPSDNRVDNLISVSTFEHHFLHTQLTKLLASWKLGITRKDVEFRVFIKYFFITNELRFNREELRYSIHPIKDGILEKYAKDLGCIGIYPMYSTPDLETEILKTHVLLSAKKEFLTNLMEVSLNEPGIN